MEEKASPAAELPLDVLTEVLARCDPRTMVRFGSASKLLWRHVSDPGFRARLIPAAAAADRFLLGLLYQHRPGDFRSEPLFTSGAGGSWRLPSAVARSMSAALFDRHKPVASRGGLVVLRSTERPLELAVCNPAAGRRCFLPPSDIYHEAYALLLLPQDGGGDPRFELLVMDMDDGRNIRTQSFSSASRAWGPVLGGSGAEIPRAYRQVQPTTTVVIGGAACWLYRGGPFSPPARRHDYGVLALDVAAGRAATWTEVPERCHRLRRMPLAVASTEPKELLLVPYSSAPGKKKEQLGLLVSELMAVSVWVLADGGAWARHVVIDRESVLEQVRPLLSNPLALGVRPMELEGVAEGSGTVVMQMFGVGILLLDLRTLQVRQLQTSLHVRPFASCPFCVYELDLMSLVPSSKPSWAG